MTQRKSYPFAFQVETSRAASACDRRPDREDTEERVTPFPHKPRCSHEYNAEMPPQTLSRSRSRKKVIGTEDTRVTQMHLARGLLPRSHPQPRPHCEGLTLARPPRGCAGTGSPLRMNLDEINAQGRIMGKACSLTCHVLAAGGALGIPGTRAAGRLGLGLRLGQGRGRNVALRRQSHGVEPPARQGPRAATCRRKRAQQGPVSHAGSSH